MEGKIRNLDPDPDFLTPISRFPGIWTLTPISWKVEYGIWTLTPISPDPDFLEGKIRNLDPDPDFLGIWTLTPIS